MESVRLDVEELAMEKGDTYQLVATVMPEDASDTTVVWSSSDSSVATVDNNGNVTAVGDGVATVTATCGEASATCAVTVTTPVTIVRGDANGDGIVNITDVVFTVNAVLHNPNANFVSEAADTNSDGTINITDVVNIVNIILAK